MSSPNPYLDAAGDQFLSGKETIPAADFHTTSTANGRYIPYTPGQTQNPGRSSHNSATAYTEIDDNPLPQLVMGDAVPEVVKPSPAVYPDAVREDFVSGPIPVQDPVGNPEHHCPQDGKRPWYKRKFVVVTVGVVAIVMILSVVLGTLGGLGVFSNNRNTSSSTSPDPTQTSSSATSSTATSAVAPPLSSSSSSATATTRPPSTSAVYSFLPPHATILPQCRLERLFVYNISFVSGNGRVHGIGWKLPYVASQDECCMNCYADTPSGCNLWTWNPWDNPLVPCTVTMGWYGDRNDTQCPYGHTNGTAFTIQQHGNGVGYSGPCGGGGTIVASE